MSSRQFIAVPVKQELEKEKNIQYSIYTNKIIINVQDEETDKIFNYDKLKINLTQVYLVFSFCCVDKSRNSSKY